jgi:hypothetical protein
MPAFIKTPKDEARWEKAKKAASKTLSESDGDSYWALTNSIYQKMEKSEMAILNKVTALLEKVRRATDEYDPYAEDTEESAPEADVREFDPDAEEARQRAEDEAISEGKDLPSDEGSDYEKDDDHYNKEEYGDDEDPEAHQSDIEESADDEDEPEEPVSPRTVKQKDPNQTSKYRQPTREELADIRNNFSFAQEGRNRDIEALKADPKVNPNLAYHGNIVEAHGRDHKAEYDKFKNSDEYKKANPIERIRLNKKFQEDWKANNPDHLKNALEGHHEAHLKGQEGHAAHKAEQQARTENVLRSGQQGASDTNLQTAIQQAGIEGKDGEIRGTVMRDPAAAFAGSADPKFMEQYAAQHAKKSPKGATEAEESYDAAPKERDVKKILGESKQRYAPYEALVAHHAPLINAAKNAAIKDFQLDSRSSEVDQSKIPEAITNAFLQAVNNYDHDFVGKSGKPASFATYLSGKIHGMVKGALKRSHEERTQVPDAMRQAQKKFEVDKAAGKTQTPPAVPAPTTPSTEPAAAPATAPVPPAAPKIKRRSADVIKQSSHSKANEILDRHQRASVAKNVQVQRNKTKVPISELGAKPWPQEPTEGEEE